MKKLSASRMTDLASHIRANADQAVIDALAGRNDTELTRLYNLDSSTIVWKNNFTVDDYRAALVWSEVDELTVGQARIWHWITQGMTVSIDASDANTQQGLTDAFAQATTTKANMMAAAKRPATIAESIFATGTGTKSMPISGTVTTAIIGRALNDNEVA